MGTLYRGSRAFFRQSPGQYPSKTPSDPESDPPRVVESMETLTSYDFIPRHTNQANRAR